MAKNVHIVFGIYSKLRLEDSFSIADHLTGEVITLGDDLRLGPISRLETADGLLKRKKWLESIGDEVITQDFNEQGSSDQKHRTGVFYLYKRSCD